MPKKLVLTGSSFCEFVKFAPHIASVGRSGQTLVEFSLVFVLLIVVAWIPADFGLAFYTGQIALNASREGARIAAAERNLAALVPASCTMPCTGAPDVLKATANRMSSALLPGAMVTVALEGSGCDQRVKVTIAGQYRYFFYHVLQLMGFNILNPVPVLRETTTRWEHQC